MPQKELLLLEILLRHKACNLFMGGNVKLYLPLWTV